MITVPFCLRVGYVAALLTALWPPSAAAQSTPESDVPPPLGRLVDIGGYRLHLHCSGTGPTVILLSGAGDFSSDWTLVQMRARRFARVCSYDRAGTAWSDPGPVPRTMRQDAFELSQLLKAAELPTPVTLVGHSIGGLIARVFAEAYPGQVAALVLVDPTHEDTTLMYQGKLTRVRDAAKGRPIPHPRTLRDGAAPAPTAEDLARFEMNQQVFGPPSIKAPFTRLPPGAQAVRLLFRSRPPRAAAGEDFWPEELDALHRSTASAAAGLGTTPLVLVLPGRTEPSPPNVDGAEWRDLLYEKRQQKLRLLQLSRQSELMEAKRSGHHIQLDEPERVIDAIKLAIRRARPTPPIAQPQGAASTEMNSTRRRRRARRSPPSWPAIFVG